MSLGVCTLAQRPTTLSSCTSPLAHFVSLAFLTGDCKYDCAVQARNGLDGVCTSDMCSARIQLHADKVRLMYAAGLIVNYEHGGDGVDVQSSEL